eukprot:CAMPEP_0185540152 /NCGR_PEP_ID=MMETSP1381-20130426/1032_1 /TAXON_ID=298111 /ORGANISM="Pavlova sp., Strain CCMP459" /LENGTH=102 /DNA_ID=CAMNT_0028151943 /DNA_START=1039 /DNA_END=1342 /DNA_ORIENTATION=-
MRNGRCMIGAEILAIRRPVCMKSCLAKKKDNTRARNIQHAGDESPPGGGEVTSYNELGKGEEGRPYGDGPAQGAHVVYEELKACYSNSRREDIVRMGRRDPT